MSESQQQDQPGVSLEDLGWKYESPDASSHRYLKGDDEKAPKTPWMLSKESARRAAELMQRDDDSARPSPEGADAGRDDDDEADAILRGSHTTILRATVSGFLSSHGHVTRQQVEAGVGVADVVSGTRFFQVACADGLSTDGLRNAVVEAYNLAGRDELPELGALVVCCLGNLADDAAELSERYSVPVMHYEAFAARFRPVPDDEGQGEGETDASIWPGGGAAEGEGEGSHVVGSFDRDEARAEGEAEASTQEAAPEPVADAAHEPGASAEPAGDPGFWVTEIDLDKVEVDPTIQSRVEGVNQAKVEEYAEAMRRGDKFPPLLLFYDGELYRLSEGFHRHPAAVLAGLKVFACAVRAGGWREARLASLASNASHGLPRTHEDRRVAVIEMITDAEWTSWSDGVIATHLGVSPPFVGIVRGRLVKLLSDPEWTNLDDEEIGSTLKVPPPFVAGARGRWLTENILGRLTESTTRTGRDGRRYDVTKSSAARRADDEEASAPTLFGGADDEADAAGTDYATSGQAVPAEGFEPGEPAHGAQGRAAPRRLDALLDELRKAGANGARAEELVAAGFTHELIDEAKAARLAEGHVNGRVFYVWLPEDVAVAIRERGEPMNAAQLEDLGCQRHVIDQAEREGLVTKSGAFYGLGGGATSATPPARVEVPEDTTSGPTPGRQTNVGRELREQAANSAHGQPPASPPPSGSAPAARPHAPATDAEREVWGKETIILTLRFLPYDGHEEGRRVLVIAHEDGGLPMTKSTREEDLPVFAGGAVGEVLGTLRQLLPGRVAARKPAAAAPAAPASAVKTEAKKRTAKATKPAAKKAATKSAKKAAKKSPAKRRGAETATTK